MKKFLLMPPPKTLVLGPVLFWLGGCASTHVASVSHPSEPWNEGGLTGRRYQTDHFEFFSTIHDAEFEAEIPPFLESAYRQFEFTLPTPSEPKRPMPTYLFGSRAEWEQFTRRRFPERFDVYSRIRSGGFTEGDTSVSFFVNRATTLATLAHEGWHQYVGARCRGPVPAWLNEGFACFHEAVETSTGRPRFTPGKNSHRINSLRDGLQRDDVLTLRQILETDAGTVISREDSVRTQVYYAQTWALVMFLRSGVNGRYASKLHALISDVAGDEYRVRESAARLRKHAPDASDAAVVFEEYFGVHPDDLNAEYYDYLVRTAGY